MPHSTTPAPTCQYPKPPLLISVAANTPNLITPCQHAQTFSAYSPTEQSYLMIPLPCKQWSCRPCAEEKIRRLAALTRDAKPTRLLTLTVDSKLWDSPRAAFDGTRAQVSELIKKLRNQFGEVEYLRVTELTKAGYPHYHLLVRSPYLPHAKVKALWAELTGAQIVDLRPVKQTFRAYTYLVKYLAKLHNIEWTERHVSYSRNFFAAKTPKDKPKNDWELIEILQMHPTTYLLQVEKTGSIVQLSPVLWKILS